MEREIPLVDDHEVSPVRADDRAAVANEKDRTGARRDSTTLKGHGSYITEVTSSRDTNSTWLSKRKRSSKTSFSFFLFLPTVDSLHPFRVSSRFRLAFSSSSRR